jgi:hypothetical protein
MRADKERAHFLGLRVFTEYVADTSWVMVAGMSSQRL